MELQHNIGLLETIRKQNNIHKYTSCISIEEIITNITKIANIQEKRRREMSAWILLELLTRCENKKDVEALNKMYSNTTLIGGDKVMSLINKEYKRLGINI